MLDDVNDEVFGIAVFLLILISVFGALGNLLSVVALWSSGKRSSTTLLVVNLSVAIVPVCLLLLPSIAYLCIRVIVDRNTSPSETHLKVLYISACIFNQVEVHTIAAMAFNSACAVAAPSFYKRLANPTVTWTILLFIWIYSTVLWIPVTIGVFGKLKANIEFLYLVEIYDPTHVYVAIHTFFCHLLPFIICVVCHVVLIVKFRRSRRQTSENCARPGTSRENQAIRTMVGLFVLYVVCALPHIVSHILKRFGDYPLSWIFIHILYFFRFCLDPLVYIFLSDIYKKALQRCLHQFAQKCFGRCCPTCCKPKSLPEALSVVTVRRSPSAQTFL